MTDSERLTAIRTRVAAASPGPWLTPDEAGDPYKVKVVDHEGCRVWPWMNEADMVFAYKAREDVEFLLAELDLRKEVNMTSILLGPYSLIRDLKIEVPTNGLGALDGS